jgi:hypothetical protein
MVKHSSLLGDKRKKTFCIIGHTRAQCYKTIFVRKLRIFVIKLQYLFLVNFSSLV